MPPKLNVQPGDLELFRSRLENIIDQRHPLVRLTRLIDWPLFEARFGALCVEGVGRPGLPTRLMVALHLLKHMDGLSDEAVCARYLDSPYVQAFCGESHFQHALPLDRSSMTRWRQRVGAERMEVLLAETLAAVERAGAVAAKHYECVTIDTTAQPKAVSHPTNSKLPRRGIETLARMARKHGITLRQSYRRVARAAQREAARLHHGGKFREAEARVRRLRTWLGRLARDIVRKMAGNAKAKAASAEMLGLINRLLHQKRSDRGADKLYSLHAPEEACIGKGNARTRFAFGVKVSVATTNGQAPGEQFVLGMQSLPAIPMTATP